MSVDGAAFDPGFSTAAMSACFSPQAHVRAMLDVEAALVMASADLGLASRAVADEIAGACTATEVDATRVLRDGWQMGTPVLALRAALAGRLSPAAAATLHDGHGSTSQDIIDTATQLQIRAGLLIIEAELLTLCRRALELATAHRATPTIGRTFLQHARPTTFGLRVAHWLDPAAALLSDIRAEGSSCCIQLGGPVGVAPAGTDGIDLGARLAERLRLQHPLTSWHGDRRRIAQVCDLVSRVAACMSKIATDVAILCSPEVGEITVRAGTSSSMAGKRNPFDSVRAVAAAHACAGAAATVSTAPAIQLERGLGGWHAEWLAVPLVFMTGAAAVEATTSCVQSLQADPAAMLRNLGDQASDAATAQAAAAVDRIVTHHGPLLEEK